MTRNIKRLSTLALSLSALWLGACSQKNEDVFDQNPSERMNTAVNATIEQLTSAQDGWILELVPNTGQYGAYSIGLRFSKSGEVLAVSEALERTSATSGELLEESQRSSYKVAADAGLSINFDTYNEAIHYYSTPDRQYAGGRGKGYQGDYEFKVLEVRSADTLILQGKKANTIAVMYRAPKPVRTYMNEVVAMKRKLFTRATLATRHQDAVVLYGTDGQGKQLCYPSAEGYNLYQVRPIDGGNAEPRPYVVTPQGLRFTSAYGERSDEFIWNDANQELVSTSGEKLIPREDPTYPLYQQYLGNYVMRIRTTDFNVVFTESGYNEYTITGLRGYNIKATFNPEHNRFEIRTQKIADLPDGNSVYICAMNGSSLSRSTATGMYSVPVEGTNPQEWEMADLGIGGFNPPINGFVQWIVTPSGGSGGQYSGGLYGNGFMSSITFKRR